jgi:serine/threonine-protein kinase
MEESAVMSGVLRPGDVLAGKYRVERVLGTGGMGVVVAAMHLKLEKRVAIKFLHPEVSRKPDLVERFAREARAASRIESEHVAKVLDVGTLDDGAPYMVMEYLEGSDLADVVKRRGGLPGQEAIEYVLQACEALAEAHKAGIVHRDLKPANLFLTTRPDGTPAIKILDFGISKVGSGEGPGMTRTSALMGSPNYMAPEQLRSARDVDARADIWALGIILHELLTGEVAFRADTVPELYVCILQNPPTPLRARRPDAPPAMEAIILRCLEKDPARRYASVAELAAALGDLASPRSRPSVERIARVIGRAPAGPASELSAFAQTAVTPPVRHDGALPQTPGPTVPGLAPALAIYQAGGHGPGHGPSYPYGNPQAQHYTPYAHPATAYGAAPGREEGTSAATVALIAIVVLVVLGGGCAACLCIDAAGRQSQSALQPAEPARRVVGATSGGVPFQRPTGWTTVSGGAASGHPFPPPSGS